MQAGGRGTRAGRWVGGQACRQAGGAGGHACRRAGQACMLALLPLTSCTVKPGPKSQNTLANTPRDSARMKAMGGLCLWQKSSSFLASAKEMLVHTTTWRHRHTHHHGSRSAAHQNLAQQHRQSKDACRGAPVCRNPAREPVACYYCSCRPIAALGLWQVTQHQISRTKGHDKVQGSCDRCPTGN